MTKLFAILSLVTALLACSQSPTPEPGTKAQPAAGKPTLTYFTMSG